LYITGNHAQITGFATVESRGVEMRVGQTTRLMTTLRPAAISETITVGARPHLIDIASSDVGDTVTAEDFRDLPTQNRNFVLFAGLVPGVIPNPQTNSESADALYINGQHQANNSFRVDGGRNDDPLAGSIGGAQVRTAIEAIQEFEIQTAQFDAEFGSATGGVLNAITKSGTNEVRGSAFVFLQNAQWNSMDFFAKREGLEQPDATFRSLGFTVGGPIVRDSLHYFISFEQSLDRQGQSRFFATRPALSYSTTEENHILNVLGRVDDELVRNQHFSLRYLSERAPQFNKVVGPLTAREGAREEHDFDLGHGAHREVDEHAVLERRGEYDAGAEALPRPLDRGRRGLVLQLGRNGCQLAEVDVDERSGYCGGVQQAHVAAHSPSPTSATYGPVSP
jgi:hypothetical protein